MANLGWKASRSVIGPTTQKGLGETPSRQKIFVCHPASRRATGNATIRTASLKAGNVTREDACARPRILSALARRAYRRPVTEGDIQALLGLYKIGFGAKGGFEAGIEMALEGILVVPAELPVPRRAGSGEHLPRPASRTIASAISVYWPPGCRSFCGAAYPTTSLLDLAERGKLRRIRRNAGGQQVARMLRDPRSKALVSNFFGQWLQLRHVAELTPDPVEPVSRVRGKPAEGLPAGDGAFPGKHGAGGPPADRLAECGLYVP